MEENYNIPTMVTIKRASELTNVSYDFLRKMCINNQIVYVKAGTKYLINLGKLVDYLNGDCREVESE